MSKTRILDVRDLIEICKKAADEVMQVYESGETGVQYKSDKSPLTLADTRSNHVICEGLTAYFPDIPIVSEENEVADFEQRKSWQRYWLVDPLDGTKEFLKRNGEFTINIALIESDVPTMGVVYAPALNLLYYASEKGGAWKDDGKTKMRLASCAPENHSNITMVKSRSHASNEELIVGKHYTIDSVIERGSSLKLCLVAEGAADVYVRQGPVMEWDVAAGDCVFRNSSMTSTQRFSPIKYTTQDMKILGFVLGVPAPGLSPHPV